MASAPSTSVALTHAQLELVIASLVAPGSALGVTGGVMDIRGPLDLQAFAQAVQSLNRQVDALNLCFKFEREQVRQCIALGHENVHYTWHDLTVHADPAAQAQELMARELQKGIELFAPEAPRVRSYFLKLGDEHLQHCMLTHHAMIDGWGFSVWVQLLAQLYQGHSVTPPSYLDHAARLEASGQHAAHQRSLAYWLDKLPAPPPSLFRPQRAADLGVALSRLTLPPERAAPWQKLAQAQGVSMASLVTAALLLELVALTGQSRPVIGLPVHRRNSPATKQTVGLFASVMPLVVDLTDQPDPCTLAARIQHVQRSDFRHSAVTLAEMCRAWALGGIQSDPLQVTFSFEHHDYNVQIPGCEVRIQGLAPAAQSRPLQIYWRQYQDDQPIQIDLAVNQAYAGHPLSPLMLEQMFDRLDRASGVPPALLSPAACQPEARMPAPAVPPSAQVLLPDNHLWALFERIARQHPEAMAVVDEEGQRLSYGELHQQAVRVASRLCALNLAPESFVGLCAQRNVRLVVSLLGILAAGCAYVPIDPSYPVERLRYLVADSGIRCVLADDPATLLPLGLEGLQVLRISDALQDGAPEQPLPPLHGQQAAYMIYTSGSTGQPKGCIVSHANVLALLAAAIPLHGYRSEDVWTLFHSYAFDFSVWELWGALATGARVVVVSQASSRDPDALHELLLRERVTVLSQTPTAFRSLVAHSDWLAEDSPPLALRRVIFGGEALDPGLLRPCFDRLGDSVVFTNMYGITETTVHVTHRDIRAHETQLGSVIGPALPHWNLYVLNEHWLPVAPGEVGEIYVGGLGVARGYHQRARLTAERMMPDVFRNDGSRMYRSGDLARLRHDGEIEYMGRMDHQVKIRGFRIELGEIEAALRLLNGVGDSVVLPWREHCDEELRLVAWVTPRPGEEAPSESTLRELLQTRLPAHMVPARFVAIAALPLTVNGKLDRQALPGPGHATATPLSVNAPSLLAETTLLMQLWKDVLGCDAGSDAHFFALGGDSLMALRMVARLRHAGYELSLADLYRQPDLQACARRLRKLPQAFPFSAPDEARSLPDGIEDSFPMMALQAGMMYHTELAPDSNVFQDVFDFEIRHPWQAGRFQQAVDALVDWAPALRTRFDWDSHQQPTLLIQHHAHLPVQIHDLRGVPPEQQEPMLRQASLQQRARRFDYAQAPLLRITVHQLDDQRFQLTLAFHHAVLDGWSFASLVATLLGHYMGELDITSLPRDQSIQKVASLQEFSARQNPELKAFWLQQLRQLPASTQPAGARRERLARLRKRYSVEALEGITGTAIRAGVSLRSALLGVHLLAQMGWRRSARVTSGCVLNCRPELPGADQAIGLFLNTLPLAAQMPGESVPISDWLRQLAQAEADLLAHRWLPLPDLLKLAQTDSLFDCAFNFVHFHIYEQRLGAKLGTIQGYQVFERTDFPLLCQFAIEPATNTLELTLCSDLERLGDPELAALEALYTRCLDWLSTETALGAPDFFVDFQQPAPLVTASAVQASTALPQHAAERSGDSPPDTWQLLEREVAALWSDVLSQPVLDRDASFFELGGDSIAATRLVAKLRKQHDLQVRLKDFFAQPTVRGVAAVMAQLRQATGTLAEAGAGATSPTPIPKAVRHSPLRHPGNASTEQRLS